MARLSYNDDFNSSVSRYRREVEKNYKRREREQAERDRQNNSLKRKINKATQPVQSLARDAMMHAKINDPTTNEIRSVKRTAGMITGFASGAALAIASAAVSGLKAAEIDDKARRLANDTASLQNDYRQLEDSLKHSDEERRAITLRTYNEDVASRTDYYRASYYGELEKREETKREIAAASEENKKYYNSQKNALELERSQVENTYAKDSKNFEKQRETINNTYDQGIASAKESHRQEIERIDKEYNNKKNDIEKSFSGEEKTAKINSLNKERADAKTKADNDYKEKESELQSNKKKAEDAQRVEEASRKQKYDDKIKELDVRAEGQKSAYSKKQSDLKIKDQESIKEMNRAKNEYLQKYVNRTEAREMPRDNSSIQELKPRGTQLETKIGPVHVQGVPVGFVTSRSVENIRNTMGQLNTDLAKRAIMELGSKEDRDLLKDYEKDEAARKRAKAEGRPFESKLSDKERKRVQDSIAAFGGTGFDSESNLKMTLKNSQNAAAAIQSKLDENKKLFSTNHASYESAVKELKGMRSRVTDSINAKKALANGKNLSDAEKAQLKSKILSKEAENNLRGKITKGEEKLKSKRAELNNLQNKMKRQEIAIAGINKQNQFLKRNGKALVSGSIYEDTKKSLKYKAKATKKEKKAQALKLKRGRALDNNKIKKAEKLKLKIARNQRAAAIAKEKRIAAMKKRSKSERGKKMAKNAARKWRNSIRGLQKRIEMKTLKGNALHSEFKHLKRATKNAAQYYTMAVNSSIFITKVAAKMIFAPLVIHNFIGKRMNAKNIKIIGRKEKDIKLTRGQSIWARRFEKSKLLQRSMRFNDKVNKLTHSKAFGRVTKVGKGILMAPAAVLTLPNKIMNLPQTMMMGAAKGTAKVAGKAIGLATKPLGKGVRVGGRALGHGIGRGARFVHRHTAGKAINKIKNSKFGKAAKRNMKRVASKIAAPLKKAAQKVKNFFDKKFFRLIRKFFGMLLTIIQSIFSYVLMFIMYMLLFVVLLMIMLLIIIVVISLIFSVIAMLLDWLYKQTAQSDTEIANNPGYILHMASNYRSEELRIFYFFNSGAKKNTENVNGNTVLLEVSRDPLWCEVYNANFNWGSNNSAEIKGTNGQAQYWLTLARNKHNNTKLKDGKTKEINKVKLKSSTWQKNVFSWFFEKLIGGTTPKDSDWKVKSEVTNYSDLWVAYLTADGDILDSDGKANMTAINTKLANLQGDEGKYEISNAKDALAIGDSIFQAKEDCQTYEILAYLGVGATQPVNGASNTVPACETLFWKSHHIVYLSGTKDSDIYYHGTANYLEPKPNGEYGEDSEHNKHEGWNYYYNLTTGKLLNSNGGDTSAYVSNKDKHTCNNMETRTFSFYRTFNFNVKKPRHTHKNNELWTTQAKKATTAKGMSPQSSWRDYWYWYQDFGTADFTFNKWGDWFKPSATETGNMDDFMFSVYGCHLRKDMPSLIWRASTGDAIYIKDSRFSKIFALKNNNGTFTLVGKSDIDNKYYQVLSYNDAQSVTEPLKNGLYTFPAGSADTPVITVLHRYSKFDDGDYVCYVPYMYYEQGHKDCYNNKVSKDVCWPDLSWSGWSGNLNDLCRNHSHLGANHVNTVTERVDLPCNEIFELCHGHITLRTVVVVTTAESKYSIFDKAAEIPKQEENYNFGVYYVDEKAGVDGWGGILVKEFDPSEDFAEGSSARGLALAKAREKNVLYDWDEDYETKVGNYYLYNSDTPIYRSITNVGGKVGWAMTNFQGEIYYTTSLKSGIQKNLSVYKLVGNEWKNGYLSLATYGGRATYKWPNKINS